jgi:predicted nucleic acid-binding protein
MSAADAFFDTNVVLYLFSADVTKADLAEDLIARGGHVSVQVLNEVANVARRKLGLSWAEIFDITAQLRAVCAIAPLTLETHLLGLQVAERYGLSVYDSMIVASALMAGCTTLYTEDMQHGQVLKDRITLRNPFVNH